MKLKKLASVLLVSAMAMSCVACGSKEQAANLEKITTEELFTKMAEQNETIKGTSAKATVDVALKMSMEGQEYEMSLDGTMNTKATLDPEKAYVQTDLKYNAFGMEGKVKTDMYTIAEDDSVKVYTLDSSDLEDGEEAEWEVTVEDASEYSDIVTELQEQMKDFKYSDVEKYLANATTTIDGSNYKLAVTIDKNNVSDILKEYEDELKENELMESFDIDTESLPEFEIALTVVVDGKTYLPKNFNFDVNLDSIEIEGTQIELTKFNIDMNFDSYDAVEITVPEAALNAESDDL